ncbi:hypothetical protein AAF712_016056 [Marasmius tenuissimus]|uniref:Uncharacterized protein n=1 Tax=Marasmius tenuissimus TaxID=585030 RepID=A0ABR2Z8J0_9AGAR
MNTKGKSVGALSTKSKGSRTLSQPMSTDWLQTYTAAADRRSEDEKRRQERQEMLERQKREVKFIVWYDPQKQPYRITYSIQHYPRASLSAILHLISNLELSDKSYIELWDFLTRSWTNVTLDSEFDVDKERTTLIRVGLSLRTILDPADCEGLQLQLDLQPHYRRGTKRVAEQLASPVKRLRIEPVDMGIDSSSIPNLPPAPAVSPRAQLPSLPCPSLSVSPSASNLFAPSSTSTLLPLSKSDIPLPPIRGPSSSRTRDVAHSTANVSKTEKRFPLDYSVAFFGIGIRKIMDEKADDPKATEVNLYPKHFGIGYRKSSAVTYKKKWNEASEALQDEFIALGDADTWAEFRRRIDLELQTQPNITPCRTTTTVPIQPTIPDRPTPSSGTHPNAQLQAQQSISPLPTSVVSCQSSLLLVQDAATARTRNIARSPIGSISPLLSPCKLVEVSNPGRCGNRESLSDYSSAFNDTASFFANDILQEEAAGRDLCPFCDEKILPPSKILSDMLSKLLLVTEPDPLPWNADHRKAASFTVTIAFCSRHRYESELAQHPQSLLWPRNIDSLTVFRRVLAIRQVILKLIHKPEGSPFFKQTYLYIREHGRISPVKRMNGGKPLCNGTG